MKSLVNFNTPNHIMNHPLLLILLLAAAFTTADAQTNPDTSNIHIISSPKSGYVIRGEKFETEIFVLAGGKTLPDQDYYVRVNGKQFFPENGRVRYSAFAADYGQNLYTVKATIQTGTEDITLSREFSYEVGQRCIAVSASKMEVFYVGVDNPLFVAAAGISTQDVRVGVTGASISRPGPYHYDVQVTQPGPVVIDVEAGSLRSTFSFRTKPIPDPTPLFGGLTLPEYKTAEEFKIPAGVGLMLEDFDFDVKCDMLSYEIMRIAPDGARESAMNEGPRFGEAARALIDKAGPGDMYIFRDIRGQCPGDEEARKLQGFSVEIN
jgi:hypothetical protein